MCFGELISKNNRNISLDESLDDKLENDLENVGNAFTDVVGSKLRIIVGLSVNVGKPLRRNI